MRQFRRLAGVTLASVTLVAGAALAVATPATAAGFPEKDVTFIIPYGPGGGFDTYVRKIAPVMQRYLPNKVNVIAKNIDGAGGNKAAAQLFRGKPDGYQISIFNMPGMLLDKILGKKTSFDVDKFEWLGRIAQSKYVLAVGAKGPNQSIQDLMKAKGTLKYAITSPASTSYVAGKIHGRYSRHEDRLPAGLQIVGQDFAVGRARRHAIVAVQRALAGEMDEVG